MHIFQCTGELELATFDFLRDSIQAFENSGTIGFCNDSLLGKHLYMCA